MKNYAKITENRKYFFFTCFMKADVEDQYMHLDSIFNALLMVPTTTSPNCIEKWLIFRGKLIFRNFHLNL